MYQSSSTSVHAFVHACVHARHILRNQFHTDVTDTFVSSSWIGRSPALLSFSSPLSFSLAFFSLSLSRSKAIFEVLARITVELTWSPRTRETKASCKVLPIFSNPAANILTRTRIAFPLPPLLLDTILWQFNDTRCRILILFFLYGVFSDVLKFSLYIWSSSWVSLYVANVLLLLLAG